MAGIIQNGQKRLTSKMERFTKKIFPPLHFFEKRSILDAWQSSQYASASGHICPHLD